MLNDLLNAIGVKAGVILAAFGGGVARPMLIPFVGAGPFATVGTILGGMLCAIFLGPIGPSYLGWPPSSQGTMAITFLVGVFGTEVLKRIGTWIAVWVPSATKGSKDA